MFRLRRLAHDLDHSRVGHARTADEDVDRLPGHRVRIDISENARRRAGRAVRGAAARFEYPTLLVAMPHAVAEAPLRIEGPGAEPVRLGIPADPLRTVDRVM